ncbi:hypothetical protein CRG98_048305 [Punica granatum]|uniref:MULE transposase domain-containing protein n=1 Tax=Punica granatum TaxID=22663 RepID=A0A2I0HHZ0_PUNGR|nr:hypothetical protein CRG98_048305 [Punica granatum]
MAWEFVEDNGYNAGPELYLDWYDDDPKFIATGGSTSHDAGAGGFGLQVAGVGGYSIEEAQMQDKSKAKRKRQNTKTRFKQRTTEERERLFVEQERIFAEQEINVVVEDLAISDAYDTDELESLKGSSVGLNVAPVSHHFQRMYVCLEACKTGFLSCGRPLIGLDGCFLKGYFGGQLLSAVAQDGNNAFYVIAYAIVDVENKENWRWFLINLVDDLGDPVLNGFSFMSDMQKGLDAALKEICPGVQHRFCARHIWANFNKNWPVASADGTNSTQGTPLVGRDFPPERPSPSAQACKD